MSPDLRGAAILAGDGTVLAASGDAAAWAEEAVGLFATADAAGEEPVEQIHVATQAGEGFALRHEGYVAVAVTERFALASLTFFDMRSALRELAKEAGRCPRSHPAPSSTASPAMPTRPPPTCAGAASAASP